MHTLIGFITSPSQIDIKELNTVSQSVTSKVVDSIELKDYPFNLLVTFDENELDTLESTLEQESKYYPIISSDQLGLTKDSVKSLSYEKIQEIYNKVINRWILNNNIKTIEQSFSLISYLKDLYINDRDNFFEELWFILKTNLASNELNIIFHDLAQPTDKQKEKGEKPKLTYSFIKGEKLPNIQPATEKEEMLMKEYQSEFNEFFNITDYSLEKGELVATIKIGLSPILIMAKLNTFNQLQKSVLISIFSGLKTN